MATTTTPPTPAPAPLPPLKSGFTTSEGVLTLIVSLLNAAIATPWIGTMPAIYKAIAGALAVINVVFYQAQRTSLKNTHAMLAMGMHPKASPATLSIASKLASVACITMFVIGACSGSGTLSQVGSAAGSAGEAGLECEGVNLEGIVGVGSDGKNISLLEQVGLDVLSANFTGAIADLVKTLGSLTVGCAVLAADDLEQGLSEIGSAGSGSATLSTNASVTRAQDAASVSLERLHMLETAYGWKRAPRKTLQRAR